MSLLWEYGGHSSKSKKVLEIYVYVLTITVAFLIYHLSNLLRMLNYDGYFF